VAPLKTQGAQKDLSWKRGTPKNTRDSKKLLMKKEALLKMQWAQKKISNEKKGTPKNTRGLKRPLMKKKSPLKIQEAQKNLWWKKSHP
jgi:hypothetical protein